MRTRVRRGWDSNPRGTFIPAGFQDRCLQPLGHPSIAYLLGTYGDWRNLWIGLTAYLAPTFLESGKFVPPLEAERPVERITLHAIRRYRRRFLASGNRQKTAPSFSRSVTRVGNRRPRRALLRCFDGARQSPCVNRLTGGRRAVRIGLRHPPTSAHHVGAAGLGAVKRRAPDIECLCMAEQKSRADAE